MGTRCHRRSSCLVSAVLLLSGCSAVGSTAIRNGRAIYNRAMVETNNEQLLDMIVHMRYEEPHGLLAVSSITANVRVQASIGAEFGIGADRNFTGNLVPLSAATLYEENPTISYTPVQGEKYLKQLLAPLPLDYVVLLLSALGDSPNTIMLLIKEINTIRNPAFLADPSDKPDPRFARVAELMASLHRGGSLTWAEAPGDKPSLVVLLRGSGDDYAKKVRELHELLGLPRPRSLDEALILRVLMAVGSHEGNVIDVMPRSVYGLFQIAAAAVEVPEDHLKSGLAPKLPPSGPAVSKIHIRRTSTKPSTAMVAVKHHGWWFSIDATDGHSKSAFRLIEAIMTARIADSVDPKASRPMLTVPVSR